VAIKILRPDRSGHEMLERFRREIRVAGFPGHDHIVTFHDAGEVAGRPYLVMEMLNGSSLDRVLERWKRLPIPDACELVCQAARGLAHAHQHNVVHRDVKPANLFLTRLGKVKILDLGLALLPEASTTPVTEDGVVMGTPPYLAPEQINDPRNVKAPADLYSLGCTLHHFLTGQPPFSMRDYPTRDAMIDAHLRVPPRNVCDLRWEVPAEESRRPFSRRGAPGNGTGAVLPGA
jgi:serine/threonine protein kinase